MSIKVIPLRRTPKKIELLDYKPKPDQQIKPGQLVKTPFRSSNIFGVVYSISNSGVNSNKLKKVEKVLYDTPILTQKKLKWLKEISDIYNISLSTQLKLGFLPIQPRKLNKIELKTFSNKEKTKAQNQPKYELFSTQTEHQDIIKDLIPNALVVLPEQRYIDTIKEKSPYSSDQTIIWHSNLTKKERFTRWLQVRNGRYKIIIGTRSCVFLPFFQLDNILIDYEHNQNHKHWDQTPRYHTHDIARKLQNFYQANLTFSSYSPSAKSYYFIYKNKYNYDDEVKNKISNSSKLENIKIINLSKERKRNKFEVFSYKLENILTNKNNTNFLYINQKGYASSIGCFSCGYIAECNQCNLPLVYKDEKQLLSCHHCQKIEQFSPICPNCNDKVVNFSGLGTEKVEERLKQLNPELKEEELVRIEKNKDQTQIDYSLNPNIVGTDRAFNIINWGKIDNVVFVNIDRQLRIPEYKVSQQVWSKIQEVVYNLKKGADFYIQTFNQKQTILRSLDQPDLFYRTELNSRKKLNYPPYCRLVRFIYGSQKSKKKSLQQSQQVYSKLSKKLTKQAENNIIINEPVEMQPNFYRGQFWHVIIAKLPKKNWGTLLKSCNKILNDSWKVDLNPVSILSH